MVGGRARGGEERRREGRGQLEGGATYEVRDVGVSLRVELDAFFFGAVAQHEAHGFRDGHFSWKRAAAVAVAVAASTGAGGHGGGVV